ncbi:cupin domain-containing protein [Haloquadratum walsbyi]|uniref:cupin domain-containing protein n=1 Tax=Haloquadratum walsbyi TaxID=293091 RepID=UPI00064E4E3B|nr:cupin domain-containing protein [Haloquadratum walsbyi]
MELVNGDSAEWEEVISGFHHKTLVVGDMMSMQAFKIEPTAEYGSKHNHANAQIGYIIEGKGLYHVEYNEDGTEISSEQEVSPGDSLYIPSGEYHNAINRGNETVSGIDVFCPPRADPSPKYFNED